MAGTDARVTGSVDKHVVKGWVVLGATHNRCDGGNVHGLSTLSVTSKQATLCMRARLREQQSQQK